MSSLEARMKELKDDLLSPGGPSISTNRNYPFAIFHYAPREEFQMRERLFQLLNDLRGKGWTILHVDLLQTFIEFLREQEESIIDAIIEEERFQYRSYHNNFEKPLEYLHNTFHSFLKDDTSFPRKVIEKIQEKVGDRDDNRAVIFLSRIGGLYPFYRTSALLRFLDKGSRVPTIILYPGERRDGYSLSFLGEMESDRDYRPRIY